MPHLRDRIAEFRAYLRMLAGVHLSPVVSARLSASDIVQEALLKAHRDFDQFRGQTEAELAGWLRAILAHTLDDCVDKELRQIRDARRDRSLEAELAASSQRIGRWLASVDSTPCQHAVSEERLWRLANALEELDEDQRIAVELKHLRGWSVRQVADHMGRTEASVAGLLRRGLDGLRQRLAEDS